MPDEAIEGWRPSTGSATPSSNIGLMNPMHATNPTVLALDLEGTLISNAMSQIPRPGLHRFLSRCQELFPRVVMFTTVEEDKFRTIARLLVADGLAPVWFADIEFVHWDGETKDLNFISGVEVTRTLLVDDFEKFVHPGQEAQWMQVDYFDYPYDSSDTGLIKMLALLEARTREP